VGLYILISQRLLPLDQKWQRQLVELPWPMKNQPEVIGGGMTTLRVLIREYFFVSLFRAYDESLASENASHLQRRTLENCWRNLMGHSIVCVRVTLTRNCSTSF